MHTFRKQEHLCGIPEIQHLFKDGNPIFKHPVKLLWLPGNWTGKPAVKLLVSVPKRNFKKATDRNYIKRLLRELYRTNKTILTQHMGEKNLMLALVYAGKEIPEFKSLESIIINLFERLITEYEKTSC
mgnify:FL=1